MPPSFIDELTQSDAYPHHPRLVEFKQTHISYVFLAGEYVYKVKKPVRFSFVDYSTLDKRRHFCHEEVRLNSRLAPSVYLGVVPIIERRGRLEFAEGTPVTSSWPVLEYAVKMCRLPAEQMLDSLLRKNRITKKMMSALAHKLVAFHEAAATERASRYGTAESIRQTIEENFQETRPFIGQTIGDREFVSLQEYSDRFLTEHTELLKTRVQEGRVREGHGDLRAEHICYLKDDILIFDCIEFNDRLRYCDVASELAFLAMDLDFLGEFLLSHTLVSTYETLTRDKGFSLLLPFYQCYRAYVRGKVESLRSQEEETPAAEREHARLQARRYFCLASRYAKGAFPAALLVVYGLPGTGKSTFARMLSDRTGFPVVNSDVTRKALAGIPATTHVPAEEHANIYSESFTQLTYEALFAQAEKYLKKRQGVILDATFLRLEHRRAAADLAARRQVPVVFIECQAKEEEIARRLKNREHNAEEVSDATWEVYLHQRARFRQTTEDLDCYHLSVNTAVDLGETPEKLERLLNR